MGAVPGRALARHIWLPPDVEASEDFPGPAHGGPVTHVFRRQRGSPLIDKQTLRSEMRTRRRDYVAALPTSTRALIFSRPPRPLVDLVPEGACVGLYHAIGAEAPADGYARFFAERGNPVALPWFARRGAAMAFRQWDNPFTDTGLVADPFGAMQPPESAEFAAIDVAFVPLVAFTAQGARLGQGGGHYDRFLADHPQVTAIGLAWDCQLVDTLPLDGHDMPLRAVVTPTRLYGPF